MSKMKIVNEEPTSGQFVAVWEYDGKIWSDVLLNENDKCKRYREEYDKFEDYGKHLFKYSPKFIVLGEDAGGTINLSKNNENIIDYNKIRVNIMRDTLLTLGNTLFDDTIEYAIITTALNIDSCIEETVGGGVTAELYYIRAQLLADVAFNLKANYFVGEEDKEETLQVLLDADDKLKNKNTCQNNTIPLTKLPIKPAGLY